MRTPSQRRTYSIASQVRGLLRRAAGPAGGARPARPLAVEQLEARAVPSVTPVFDPVNHQVVFQGSVGATDNLFLRTNSAGVLLFSTDGVNFSPSLDPAGHALTLSNASAVAADVGGTVYVGSLPRAGGRIAAAGPLTISAGAVVRTQQADGSAADLAFAAPSITVGDRASIRADGALGRPNGDLSFTAAAGLDRTFAAVTPVFQNRTAAAGVSVGAADIHGRNVSFSAATTTSKFADIEVDLDALTADPTKYFAKLADPAATRLTFDRSNGTITRNAGSWVADGFHAGQTVQVSGTTAGADDGLFNLAAVTDTTLTLVTGAGVRGVVDQAVTGADVRQTLARLAGAPGLTFGRGGAGDTVTRAAGSWLADGFAPGQSVYLSGTPFGNDGAYTVAAVTDTTLTFGTDGRLNAGSSITRIGGSWVADGFAAGRTIHVSNTAHNNGDYRVAGVSDGVLTLDPAAVLVAESLAGATITQDGGAALSGNPALTFAADVRVNPAVTIQGTPTLTLAPADGGDTISRSAGSWAADGFRPGQAIRLTGTGANDGVYTIAAETAGTLTLTTANTLKAASVTFSAGATPVAVAEPAIASVFTDLPADQVPLVARLRDGTRAVQQGGTALVAKDVVNNLEQAGTRLAAFGDSLVDVGQAVLSSATSRIVFAAGATVAADGNVSVVSTTDADVTLKAPGLSLPLVNGFGSPFAAGFGSSDAAATALVQAGATITAGGTFTLRTAVHNTLSVTMTAPAGIITGTDALTLAGVLKSPIRVPAPGLSLAAGHADSESESGVAAGATVTAGAVAASATNTNNFAVAAESTVVSPKTNFGEGVGVALGDYTSHALVHLDGRVTAAAGGVTAAADSTDQTDSTTSVALVTGAPSASPVFNKLNTLLAAPGEDPLLKGAGGPKASKFGMAAGAALVTGTNAAAARVGAGAVVTATGDVAVTAHAEDDLKASASGSSFSLTTPTDPGTQTSLGGAAVLGTFDNLADAAVGAGAVVSAGGGVSVRGTAVVPAHLPFTTEAQNAIDFYRNLQGLAQQDKPAVDTSGPAAFASSLEDATKFAADAAGGVLSGVAGTISPLLTFANSTLGANNLATTNTVSSASSKTQDGDGKFAFAGSVDVLHVVNHGTATVGEGARVTAGGGGGVNVAAEADVTAINLAGMGTVLGLLLSKGAPGAASDGVGLGTNFSAAVYDNAAAATVADGAVVSSAAGVGVTANTSVVSVTAGQAGAAAARFGLGLTAGLNFVSNVTTAAIDSGATVTATAGSGVTVAATGDLTGVDFGFALASSLGTGRAGTGGLETTSQVGVGLTAGGNYFAPTTKAFVGKTTATPAFTAPGRVTAAGDVAVTAVDREVLVGLSVAGAVAPGQSPPTRPRSGGVSEATAGTGTNPTEAGSATQTVGGLGKLAQGLKASAAGAAGAVGNLKSNIASDLNDLKATPGKVRDFVKNIGKGPANSTGVGVSGDAAVNVVNADTEAYTADGAVVTAGGGVSVRAAGVTILAGSTVAVSVGGTSKGSGLAGSLLLDVTTRTTRAAVGDGTTVTAGGDVTVAARAIGVDASVAAGGAGSSPTNQSSVGLVGTFNAHALANNTEATIGAGARVTAGRDVTLAAKNYAVVVSGAGGVAISGQVGFGAGLGVDVLIDTARAGVGDGATVTAGRDVTATAANAEFDMTLAADLGISAGAEGLGLSGSGAVVTIAPDEEATIGRGATVTAGGAVALAATDTANVVAAAGAIGVGATGEGAGVGIAFAPVVVVRTGLAAVGDGATVRAGGGVSVSATAADHLVAAAGAGGGGGTVGVAASLAAPVVASDVEATIGAARVTALGGDVAVTATHATDLAAAGGGIGLAVEQGEAGVGAAATPVGVGRVLVASIGAGAVVAATGNVTVQATATDRILSLVGGVAGAAEVGVAGSVATAVVASDIEATVGDGAAVAARRNVVVQGVSELAALPFAGVLGVGSENAGVGASDSTVVHLTDLTAAVGRNAAVAALGRGPASDVNTGTRTGLSLDTTPVKGVAVTATALDDLVAVAVGAAGSQQVGVAGSSVVNLLLERTRAGIGAGARVNQATPGADPAQTVYVQATNQTTLGGVAGVLGVSAGGTAVGAGADIGVSLKDTEAGIGAGAVVRANRDVVVNARSLEYDLSLAASGSISAGEVAVAGAAGLQTLVVTTLASVRAGAMVFAGDTVAVTATDDAHILSFDGQIAVSTGDGSGGAALGAAAVVKDTEATIGGGASVTGLGDGPGLSVADGNYDETYVNYAAGLLSDLPPALSSVAADYVTGVRDTDPQNKRLLSADTNESQFLPADLDAGGQPSAETVLAKMRKTTPHVTLVKGVAVTAAARTEAERASVGGSVAEFTIALSGAADVAVTTTRAAVADGARINQDTDAGAAPDQSVLVAAGADSSTLVLAGTAAIGAEYAAVGAAATVDVAAQTTTATIGAAAVSAAGDVTVRAGAREHDFALAAGFSAGLVYAAATGTATVFFVKDTTTASIGSGAVVAAGGTVAVLANDDTSGTAVDGGAAAAVQDVGVGIAGSLAVSPIIKDTEAFVAPRATVTAGGASAPLAAPAGGIAPGGGSFTTHPVSGVVVGAESAEQLFTVTVDGSLAVGVEPIAFAGALAGNVSAAVDLATTRAYVGDGAAVTSGRDVSVTAVNAVDLFAADGSVAAAVNVIAAGLSGGADLGIVRNTTTAYVGDGAAVHAAGGVGLLALADKKATSLAASLAAGTLGIGGAVSVYALGGSLDSTQNKARKALTANDGSGTTVGGYADSQTAAPGQTALLGGYSSENQSRDGNLPDDTELSGQSAGDLQALLAANLPRNQVSAAVAATDPPTGAAAFVGAGAVVTAGGAVDVGAKDQTHLVQIAGAGGFGLLSLGFGGSVVVTVLNSHPQAYLDAGATVAAGGDVTVAADLNEVVTGFGLAGGLGLVGLGAQVTLAFDSSTAGAAIDDGATVAGADHLAVSATSAARIDEQSIGAGGGLVGGGASVATITADGSTTAHVGDGARIGTTPGQAVNHVAVTAAGDGQYVARTYALAEGGDALGASVAVVSATPGVLATVGKNAAIKSVAETAVRARSAIGALNIPYVAGSQGYAVTDPNGVVIPNLDSTADPTAMADALGIQLALGVAGGASVAKATATPTVQVAVGPGSALAAGTDLTLRALDNVNPDGSEAPRAVKAHAIVSSGALELAAAGGVALATDAPAVTVTVGGVPDNQTGRPAAPAALSAGGNLALTALTQTAAGADAFGLDIAGLLGVGITIGTATAGGSAGVLLQNSSAAAGQDFTARAVADDSATAHTKAVSGGLLAGLGTVATVNLSDAVSAVLTGASTVTAGRDVAVKAADHTYASAEGRGITAGAVAVGVSQAKTSVNPTVTASAGGSVSAGRDVLVVAGSNYDTDALPADPQPDLQAADMASAFVNASSYGGIAVAVNQAAADRSASVGAGAAANAVLAAGRDLILQTGDGNFVTATAFGDAFGVIGAGAVIGRGSSTDSVQTTVGDDARLSAGRNLTAHTLAAHTVQTTTHAAGGGILAGVGSDAGSVATATDAAAVGDGATLTAGGDVTVQTNSTDSPTADAEGTVNAAVAVGISTSNTTGNITSSAALGSQDVVTAGGNVTINAVHDTPRGHLRTDFFFLDYSGWPASYQDGNGNTVRWPVDLHPAGNSEYLGDYPDDMKPGGALSGEGLYSSPYSVNSTAVASVGAFLIGVTSAAASSSSTVVNTTAVAGGTQVTAGRDVAVTATSDAFGNTHADNSVSADFVAIGQTGTSTTLDHTNQTRLGGNVGITAGGNLTVRTETGNHADGFAHGYGAAFLAIGTNSATTNVKYAAGAAVGDNDRLTAGGALAVGSRTRTDANADSQYNGGGRVGEADSTATVVIGGRAVNPYDYADESGASPGSYGTLDQSGNPTAPGANHPGVPTLDQLAVHTDTTVGSGAVLAGDTVAVTADTALAEAYATGGTDNRDTSSFFGYSRAKGVGAVFADTAAAVLVKGGARLAGASGVTLAATHGSEQDYRHNPNFTGTGSFGSADVSAGPENGADAITTNVQQGTATVTTLAGSAVETPALAVTAAATTGRHYQGDYHPERDAHSYYYSYGGATAATAFNSAVTVDEPALTLDVAPDGTVTSHGLAYDTDTPGVVNVHPAAGAGYGTVTFTNAIDLPPIAAAYNAYHSYQPPVPPDDPGQTGGPGSGEQAGYHTTSGLTGTAAVGFSDTPNRVSITNRSAETLRLDGIDLTAAAAGVPAVTFYGTYPATNPQSVIQTPYTYFDGYYSNGQSFDFGDLHFTVSTAPAAAAAVDVENTGTSRVVLAGTINNPTGAVTVRNTGGGVLSDSGGMVVGRDVVLAAAGGNVGGPAGIPVVVRLVQSDSSSNGTVTHRRPTLTATSPGGAIVLDVQGVSLNGLPLVEQWNGSAAGDITATAEPGTDGAGNAVPTQVNLNGAAATRGLSVSGAADLVITQTLTAGGTATLASTTGAVREQGAVAGGAVTAQKAVLRAVTGIGAAGGPDGFFDISAPNVDAAVTAGGLALRDAADAAVALTASGPIQFTGTGAVTVAGPVASSAGDVTLKAGTTLGQTAAGTGVQGRSVSLTAPGGIGTAAQPVTVAATALTTRSATADQFLAAAGTVPLTAPDALDAGTGTVHLTGGTFRADGGLGPKVAADGATLTGTGSAGGALTVTTGVLSPGSPVGQLSAGPGDVTLGAGATYHAVLASAASANQLRGTGTVALGGATLDLAPAAGYTPAHGDTFTLVVGQAVTGTFAGGPVYTVNGVAMTAVYNPTSVVLVADTAPTVSAAGTLPTRENTPASGTVAAADAEGDPVTYRVTTPPAKGTLALDPTTGAYTYTPAPGARGDDSFAVAASDGTLTGTPVVVHVTIAGVATRPTLTASDARGVKGAAVPLPIAATANPSDALTVTVAGVPAGASLSAGARQADGTYLLTPAQLPGLTLTDPAAETLTLTVTATATASPGGDTATTTTRITVTLDPAAVVLTAGSNVTAVAGSLRGPAVLATFTDPAGPADPAAYTVVVNWGDGTAADTGSAVTAAGGVFTVTGWHTYASPGAHTVTVTVTHGGSAATATHLSAAVTAVPAAVAPGILANLAGLGADPRATSADFDGDGVADYVVASGPGVPNLVYVIDGRTGAVVSQFSPFEASFTDGMYVTAGDLSGTGRPVVVITPDEGGGPVVAVYDGAGLSAGRAAGAELTRFYGIDDPAFRGGCRAAVGEAGGQSVLVVTAGFGGGPRVAVFDGRAVAAGSRTPARLVPDFYAFEPTLRYGAFAAVGDVTGDGVEDFAFGSGPTGGPRVRLIDGTELFAGPPASLDDLAEIADFMTADPADRGGTEVALRDVTGDGRADLVTRSGDPARVRTYTAGTLLAAHPSDPTPDDDTLLEGVFVG